MNLQQLHDLAASRSYFSRPDNEVYQALSSASKKVYLWTAREYRNYFLKTDATTIQLAANVQQYACPPDLAILIRIGEQPLNSAPNTPFNWMRPADMTSDRFIVKEFQSLVINQYTPASEFVFAGPFLDQVNAVKQKGAVAQGPKQLQFAPIPFDSRTVKIVYAAQFLEIAGPNDPVMMPMESHEAILDYAVAELVRANGDAMAETYEAQGDKKFQQDFLPFYRQQQITQYPLTQEAYLDDLD